MVGIIQKGGLPSLYAGWGAVLCRNVPHSIIKVTYLVFLFFVLLRTYLSVLNDSGACFRSYDSRHTLIGRSLDLLLPFQICFP